MWTSIISKRALSRLQLTVVDAFASRTFAGNPAVGDRVLDRRRGLVRFALVQPNPGSRLPWARELAAEHVLVTEHRHDNLLTFKTRVGILVVDRLDEAYRMSIPSRPPSALAHADERSLNALWNGTDVQLFENFENFFAVFSSETAVREYRHFRSISKFHPFGVVITAPGERVDFVSRYFAPSFGIPEDRVDRIVLSSPVLLE